MSWAENEATPARAQISLAGTWRMTETQDTSDAVPSAGGQDIQVPATMFRSPEGGSHFIWYQRDISIPAGWQGRRIFADFRGARYAPCLFLDGKKVASQFNGFSPFKTEITADVQPGQTCRLALRCQDRSAVFVPGHIQKPGADSRASMLAPAGGFKDSLGIWDDLLLESSPQDRINEDDLVIAPSTRQGALALQGTVSSSHQDLMIGGCVLDDGKPVLTLPRAPITGGLWNLRTPFPNARDWSPEDPHLYVLELDLYQGQTVLDTLSQTFGFKEIWTEGPNFFLNGAKRHLLASATWPIADPEPDAAIDRKVAAIRASNTIAFRLHNQPWPEEWLRAADRAGLLIVDETPLYTDGDGSYAYNDPKFFANYREQVRGMIRRDRNHACLALWSLANEILFMNNQQYDKNLPEQLGGVGQFAKSLDPTHPITFEADQDPGGDADVIGLHYPHEMPSVYDYPNTADWLGSRTTTEAAGGLLGQHSTSFFWERKKPLYIGEYLWSPQQDYSVGSIYYGDDAYLNRDDYYNRSKTRAFYDQTIGYRRSGVSGMSPWTVFGFGGVVGDPAAVANEREFYTPVAAFPRDRGFRFYAGTVVHLSFDVFADDGKPHQLALRLQRVGSAVPIAERKLSLQPGDYRLVTLSFPAPRVATQDMHWQVKSVLLADGKPVHQQQWTLHFYQNSPLHAPAGARLIVYDPSGRWAGSLRSLTGLVPKPRTVLIIAPDAFTQDDDKTPTITNNDGGARALQAYLSAGGHVLVLDQETLGPLGLDLDIVGHASTMTFPLRRSHPILAGLTPDDLCDWRGDNYVTHQEVRRPRQHGAHAVTVSGGEDSLAQSPIVEAAVGRGWVVVMQALAAEKQDVEPAAQRLLQNAVNYLAAMPPAVPGNTRVISDNAAFQKAVSSLGLAAEQSAPAHFLILDGAPEKAGMEQAISEVLRGGGTVYWHAPAPEAFRALRHVLGADGLEMQEEERGTSLRGRENPLLSGVSREDLTYTTVPSGWDHHMETDIHASSRQFLPALPTGARMTGVDLDTVQVTGGQKEAESIAFHSGGTMTLNLTAHAAGLYRLQISAEGTEDAGTFPLLRVDINGHQSSWLPLVDAKRRDYVTLVDLLAGKNEGVLTILNASSTRSLRLDGVALGPRAEYPSGTQVLGMPGALVTWREGTGRVVLDGLEWDSNTQNALRGARYASALFANLGFAFALPKNIPHGQAIPLSAFTLKGGSPYFSQTPDEITLRSNGLVEASVRFAQAGRYHFRVYGYSTPCQGVYGMARVMVDGQDAGTAEVRSATAQWFDVGDVPVPEGIHTVGLEFTNDAAVGVEDRNLFIQGISAAPATE